MLLDGFLVMKQQIWWEKHTEIFINVCGWRKLDWANKNTEGIGETIIQIYDR